MRFLFHSMVTVDINRNIYSEIIRNPELVPVGIIDTSCCTGVEYRQWQCNRSSCTVNCIERNIITMRELVVADKVYTMRLVKIGWIIFATVYDLTSNGVVSFNSDLE